MSRRAEIEIFGGGFVVRMRGVEQLWAPPLSPVMFIASDWAFHFATIEEARAFCWACQFTWSVKAP